MSQNTSLSLIEKAQSQIRRSQQFGSLNNSRLESRLDSRLDQSYHKEDTPLNKPFPRPSSYLRVAHPSPAVSSLMTMPSQVLPFTPQENYDAVIISLQQQLNETKQQLQTNIEILQEQDEQESKIILMGNEIERLSHLLRDKDMEVQALQKEKEELVQKNKVEPHHRLAQLEQTVARQKETIDQNIRMKEQVERELGKAQIADLLRKEQQSLEQEEQLEALRTQNTILQESLQEKERENKEWQSKLTILHKEYQQLEEINRGFLSSSTLQANGSYSKLLVENNSLQEQLRSMEKQKEKHLQEHRHLQNQMEILLQERRREENMPRNVHMPIRNQVGSPPVMQRVFKAPVQLRGFSQSLSATLARPSFRVNLPQ